MTDRRRFSGKRFGPNGEYASRQELQLHVNYPGIEYQPKIRITYSQDYAYLPDFRLGVDEETGLAVYVEAKEIFLADMAAKYEAVVDCNGGMHLLIVTPNIRTLDLKRLNAHPRITVIVSRNIIPMEWLNRCK